ncbi:hypothetical protein N8Z02_00590 [Pelagibacteraceae bacterium]|nr:hypothetical protein [Pelagibacteraceae bacterium]
MKKIIFLTIVLFSFTFTVNAVEKSDCSSLKKISKAYIACKSGNFKTNMKKNNIVKTGANVSKGIVGKVKNFGKKVNNPFKKKK